MSVISRCAGILLWSTVQLPAVAYTAGEGQHGSGARESDDSVSAQVHVTDLEWQVTDTGGLAAWDATVRIGTDADALRLRSEGERSDGTTALLTHHVFYSRAVSRSWHLEAGVRHDTRPGVTRSWLALGVSGTALYRIDTGLLFYAGESGQGAVRLEVSRAFPLARGLQLVPGLDVNAYRRDEPARGIRSGLNDLEFELRLQFELHHRFVPYLGFRHLRNLAADAVPKRENRVMAGINFRF